MKGTTLVEFGLKWNEKMFCFSIFFYREKKLPRSRGTLLEFFNEKFVKRVSIFTTKKNQTHHLNK